MKDKSDRGYKPMAFCKPPDVFVSVRQEVEVKNNLTDAPTKWVIGEELV
mgnify:CR=1 FL=1